MSFPILDQDLEHHITNLESQLSYLRQRLIDRDQHKQRKVCPNKINGSCPLPNIHCAYPACET